MRGFFNKLLGRAEPDKERPPAPPRPPEPPPEPQPEPAPSPDSEDHPSPPGSLFPTLPTAGEMAGFLMQLMGSRSGGTVLANLGRSLPSEKALHLAESGYQPTPAQLATLTATLGPPLQPATLAAFAALIDVERDRPPELSPEALATVAALFDYPSQPGVVDVELLERLKSLGTKRNAVEALDDMARESGSHRVREFVDRVRPQMPRGHFRVNDELLSLNSLLEATGRKVNPHTLMAAAMFCDVEVGNVTESDVSRLARSAESFDTSMYALMATAGAFGLPLTAYGLEAADQPGPVAALAEGGALACYHKPGEPGRWWEHLESAADARRAEELGLEFQGLMLARLPLLEHLSNRDLDNLLAFRRPLLVGSVDEDERHVLTITERPDYQTFDGRVAARLEAPTGDPDELHVSGQRVVLPDLADFPGRVRELGMGSLLGWKGSLSERMRRIRQLDAAARRALRRPARISLRRHPERLAPLISYLESHMAEAHLEGLTDQATREGVMRIMLRDTSVDFFMHEALARVDAPAAALSVLYFLLTSEAVRLPNTIKQFDGQRFRTLVFSRLAEQASKEPAARLLATHELNPDGNARLMTEYELAQLAIGGDADVAGAALEGLIRLSLHELQPLPELVEVGPPQEDAEPSRLDPARTQAALRELESWVAELGEKDELAPLGLPFTDPQGHVLPDRARPLAERMAAVLQASEGDDSLRRRRYYTLIPEQPLRRMGAALIESWLHLARVMGKTPEQLVAHPNPASLLTEHRTLLENPSSALIAAWKGHPYLGGPPEERNTIYHFTPEEGWGIWTFQPRPPGPPERRESKLFRDMVEMARRLSLDQLYLARIDERVEGLPTFDPWISTSKRIDLKHLEVLLPEQARFVPVTVFLDELVGYDYGAQWPALKALLELYRGGPHSVVFAAAAQAVSGDSSPRYRGLQLDEASREAAARRLIATLELAEEDTAAVARMLSR